MPVNTNISDGANISKDTATEADVLDGMTFHAGKSQKQRTGTMADKTGSTQAADAFLDSDSNQVQMKIPVTGKYNTASKLYATYSSVLTLIGLTADMLKAGVSVLGLEGTFSSGGTATEEDILEGKTASVGGKDVVGTMADKSGTTTSATASLDTSNSRLRMKIPTTAKHDTSSYLYATYSAIRTLIGLTASVIATGPTLVGIEGTYTGLGDASASDVLTGKTFSTASLSNASGTMADKTGTTQEADISIDSDNDRVQMKIPATGKYNTSSYLYAAFSGIRSLIGLTASVIATGTTVLGLEGTYKGLGDASASDVLTGKTFSTASLSGASGTMADKSGTTQSGTASLDTTNSRVQLTIPATGKYSTASKLYATYSTIRDLIGLTAAKLATGVSVLGLTGTYKGVGTATAAQVLSGYTFSSASLSGASGSMTNRGAVSPSALDPGGSYTVPAGYHNGSGKVTAKAKTIKQLSAIACFGFGSTDTSDGLSEEESYTCTAAGTCYNNGMTASYGTTAPTSTEATCEIYKNGSVVNSRNIDANNDYRWRTSMVGQSFSVAKGDVVKVVASVTKGSSATRSRMSCIDATIVMFG
ncbi:MAG: hypothetical protein LUC83_08305 [Clostridiales bacterium]|nr:hypothetical protein [Clostridiales bacterium]